MCRAIVPMYYFSWCFVIYYQGARAFGNHKLWSEKRIADEIICHHHYSKPTEGFNCSKNGI